MPHFTKSFLNFSMLVQLPFSNTNRDQAGAPKHMFMNGNRIRWSSQSHKRATRLSKHMLNLMNPTKPAGLEWITTDAQQEPRTKDLGVAIHKYLLSKGLNETLAYKSAYQLARAFSGFDKDKLKAGVLHHTTMVHYTFNILRRITDVLDKLISGQSGVTQEDIDSIHPSNGCSPDLALFGQMLVSSDEKDAEKKEAEAKTKELDKKRKKAEKAGEEYVEPEESEDDPKLTGGLSFKALNIKSDGALSLNHAFTVHEAQMEIDFFTAVDDLAESGAGHVDTAHYASGLFYLSGSINRELLVKNLQGDVGLAKETMRKYIEAAIKTVPSGKKNSTNPYEWALYTMVELADEAMTHSTAFTEPLNSDRGIIKNAIEALQGWAKAKETCCNLDLQRMEFNLWDKTRDIKSLMDFVSQD